MLTVLVVNTSRGPREAPYGLGGRWVWDLRSALLWSPLSTVTLTKNVMVLVNFGNQHLVMETDVQPRSGDTH